MHAFSNEEEASTSSDDSAEAKGHQSVSYQDGIEFRPGEASLKTRVIAIALPLMICAILNLIYQIAAYFPGKRYLVWMESQPACWSNNTRLPDLLLDLPFTGISEDDAWTPISDTFPAVLLVLTALYIIIRGHYVIANRLFLTQGFLILLNTLVENGTTIPSSYGYDRCVRYLGITDSRDVNFGVNLTGSCAAMIWSGHTMHTLLAAYMLGKGLEKDFPSLAGPRICGVFHVKSVIVILLGLIEAFFLVMAHAHYTVDMLLAIIIGLLTLTNHSIKVFCLRLNPWLCSMIPEVELDLLFQPHKIQRKLASGSRSKLPG